MLEAPYFKPPQEGPIFPDTDGSLAADFETFLGAVNRDVADAVARQNLHDIARDSYKIWLKNRLRSTTHNLSPEQLELIIEFLVAQKYDSN